MSEKTIVTCAITGSFDTARRNPAVPVTPREIADSAIEAARAGAAIAHIHVRDPETKLASMELALYREVVERIHDSGVDVVINLTTGAGARFIPSAENVQIGGPGTTLASPERRVEHILELRPEICTLDIGSINFGEQAFLNLPGHLRTMADLTREVGVKPELEVFDIGHVGLAKQLIKEGHIDTPSMFQICLGIAHGAPATAEALVYLRSQLPENCAWGAFGISHQEFPIVAMTAAMGGNVRVGLEDNLYLSRGTLAPDNATLVRRAVDICHALNQEIASPAETRAILGLSGPR